MRAGRSGNNAWTVPGKPPVTLEAGEALQTVAGEVHNLKNASTTARAKAPAFYWRRPGAALRRTS